MNFCSLHKDETILSCVVVDDVHYDLSSQISSFDAGFIETGDIVTTGAPAGVGFGMDPKTFLKPGDRVETTIRGLGTQRQTVVAES